MRTKNPQTLTQALNAAGYKCLGWKNDWKDVWFDMDGNITTNIQFRKSVGYSPVDHPEYCKCKDAKHYRDDVQHNSRGSENTVSCDICKIYWKYDCSD